MDNLNWHDQADVYLTATGAFDTATARNQAFFSAAAVAFDNGFLFLRPRNDPKTYAVAAANVVRVELPAHE